MAFSKDLYICLYGFIQLAYVRTYRRTVDIIEDGFKRGTEEDLFRI